MSKQTLIKLAFIIAAYRPIQFTHYVAQTGSWTFGVKGSMLSSPGVRLQAASTASSPLEQVQNTEREANSPVKT